MARESDLNIEPLLQIGPFWLGAKTVQDFKKACKKSKKAQREIIIMLVQQFIAATEKVSNS